MEYNILETSFMRFKYAGLFLLVYNCNELTENELSNETREGK
jgi:hypothetical protein